MTKPNRPAVTWDLPGKLTVTYNTTSGPFTTTADCAPVGAYLDIEATVHGVQVTTSGTGHMVLKSTNGGMCVATAPKDVMAKFGDVLRSAGPVSLRGTLKAVTPADGSDGSEPCVRLTHAELAGADEATEPHEVGWGDDGQAHAETMAWAAEGGQPIVYTDAHGKRFLFTVQPYEG